jgi:lipopolysaccharide transport system permease protein
MERNKTLYKTIRGGNIKVNEYLIRVWQARNLIVVFAMRDLKVQYAQTYFGLLWSMIQPLTGLIIFTFFFQRVIPLKLNVPYSAFAFTGIMGWFYFTALVGQAGTVLMNNQQLLKKIRFPSLILPLSKALVGLVEFSISLVILNVVLLANHFSLSPKIIFLPVAVLANIIVGLSVGIWLSALTIRFRDLHHIIPYLIGFGIWLTPVFYPSGMVPENYKWLYYFHPVANIIAFYRWIFIGLPMNWPQFVCSFAVALVLFMTGLPFFIRNEKFIADYL